MTRSAHPEVEGKSGPSRLVLVRHHASSVRHPNRTPRTRSPPALPSGLSGASLPVSRPHAAAISPEDPYAVEVVGEGSRKGLKGPESAKGGMTCIGNADPSARWHDNDNTPVIRFGDQGRSLVSFTAEELQADPEPIFEGYQGSAFRAGKPERARNRRR